MKRLRINLSESAYEYLKKVKEENPELKINSSVIEKVIREHKSLETQNVIKKIENILTGIRLSSRTAEKNSWILFEMLNQYLCSKDEIQNHHRFIPSHKLKSVITEGAEKHIDDKLQKYRTAKIERLETHE